jgi:hypothetical protein
MTALIPVVLLVALANPEQTAKYDNYIRTVEAQPITWEWPEPNHGDTVDLDGALIHDWSGSTFIPGVKLGQVASFLQDYSVHKDYYKPEVVDTRLVRHDGNDWVIHYRLVKHYVVNIILDIEQTVHFEPISPTRLRSRSEATHITDLRARPGHDHGFMWRMNTYWRMEEKDGGVYVSCRIVSLSRSPPYGLGWLINPIIRTLPRDSLTRLLDATRGAVLSRAR